MKPIGVVLAGGSSKRMGRDKATLPSEDAETNWMTAAAERLREVTEDVWVVGRNRPKDHTRKPKRQDETDPARPRPASASSPATREWITRFLPDERFGQGPLGGIETALVHAGARSILTLPVDLPLMTSSLLVRLVDEAEVGAPLPAYCFARADGHLEPAVALYRPEALEPLREFLDAGERSVARFLLRIGTVPSVLCSEDETAFRNINTPAELDQFRREKGD